LNTFSVDPFQSCPFGGFEGRALPRVSKIALLYGLHDF
jgi:hypothetical protein